MFSELILENLEESLRMNEPIEIDGEFIDKYTSQLIIMAAKQLSEDNRERYFELPIDQMVAVAYKILNT